MASPSKETVSSTPPEAIQETLPIRMISKVVKGFGRGSSELGIPTANLSSSPEDMKCQMSFESLPTGIYFGFARLVDSNSKHTGNHDNEESFEGVFKAAISIGYNPCYKNQHKTIEPHLIAPPGHPARTRSSCKESQFNELYDQTMRLSIVGYLRPELPFEGLDKLIIAIKGDIVKTEELCDGSGIQDVQVQLEGEKAWVLSNNNA